MSTQHYCDDTETWEPGTVRSCPNHGRQYTGKKQQGYRVNLKEKRAGDREAGVVGTDRGGYISG